MADAATAAGAPATAAGVADAEQTLEDAWARQLDALIRRHGMAPAAARRQLARERARRRFVEELRVCRMLIDAEAWRDDVSCCERDLRLCHAAALEGLGRRDAAVDALREALEAAPRDPDFALLLAKLLFKANRNEEALNLCIGICDMRPAPEAREAELVADAFHLAGWIRIHADHHTAAYALWRQGHEVVPSCPVLRRQAAKRACWDDGADAHAGPEDVSSMVGGAPLPAAFDAYKVHPSRRTCTPALALFDPETQQEQVVFRSKTPVLTSEECANVLRCVSEFHAAERGGVWSTVRHSSVPTTDIAVEDIPQLRPWLRQLLATRLYPMLELTYPRLADGSTLVDKDGATRMRVHDAFIVRYDAERDQSLSLPEHRDTSSMSFTVALNQRGAKFEGGGTWFEALGPDGKGQVVTADQGHAVAFAGPLRHAGYPITSGTRVILVLFLYVDCFQYGPLIADYLKTHGCDICASSPGGNGNDSSSIDDEPDGEQSASDGSLETEVRPSGDAPGGFVVYNQTVELVNMLNKSVKSVLD